MSSDVMRTSITASKQTVEILKELRFDLRVETIEEVILKLVEEHKSKEAT